MDKKTKHLLNKWLDRGVNLLFGVCGCVLLWLFVQIFCLAFFHIPTGSMEPNLLAGDVVLVNKWTYGARLFNVLDAVDGKQVEILRMPGIRKIERNDVVVFNNPYPKHWMQMEMDVRQYYVKRCIALPGDIFRIENGRYKVSDYMGDLGNVTAQDRFRELIKEQTLPDNAIRVRAYPGDSLIEWTAVTFGPFYIPRAEDSIPMNRRTFLLYRKVIEWEQKEKLSYKEGCVYIADEPMKGYRFLNNYYFVVGDKVENSKDSRYWGVLPEEYIVGKVWRIWKSVDKSSGDIRRDRIWKKVR